jgi:hypothetical protein
VRSTVHVLSGPRTDGLDGKRCEGVLAALQLDLTLLRSLLNGLFVDESLTRVPVRDGRSARRARVAHAPDLRRVERAIAMPIRALEVGARALAVEVERPDDAAPVFSFRSRRAKSQRIASVTAGPRTVGSGEVAPEQYPPGVIGRPDEAEQDDGGANFVPAGEGAKGPLQELLELTTRTNELPTQRHALDGPYEPSLHAWPPPALSSAHAEVAPGMVLRDVLNGISHEANGRPATEAIARTGSSSGDDGDDQSVLDQVSTAPPVLARARESAEKVAPLDLTSIAAELVVRPELIGGIEAVVTHLEGVEQIVDKRSRAVWFAAPTVAPNLTADLVAELVNESLLEQARLHGIDVR